MKKNHMALDLFANVVIRPLDGYFTYKIPPMLVGQIDIGNEVIVPLGKKRTTSAYVAQITEECSQKYEIKDLITLANPDTAFTQTDLEFFKWISDYYGEPLSVVIDTAIPRYQAPRKQRHIKIQSLDFDINKLRSKSQRLVFEFLNREPEKEFSVAELPSNIPNLSTAINELVKKELISSSMTDTKNIFTDAPVATWAKTNVDLSEDQKNSLNDIIKLINANKPGAALLHGVTGSGKTEVYIEAIQYLLQQNKGTIVLVPEIALTPQLIDRFYARLGNEVSVLHSGLKDRDRWHNWQAIKSGHKRVLIGARSALFAPMANLGLIIIDEEHDGSFKQNEGLRYNARDLSFVKAKLNNAVVILGSATPSLETFHRAITKQISYLPLSSRHESASSINISIVDMNQLKPWELPSSHISPLLFEELKNCLDKKEQAFILFNRRGYSHYVQCEKCETSISCPNCAVTLTYHQNSNNLLCHCCSYNMQVPTFCPYCRSSDKDAVPGQLSMRGSGTEKTEDELKRLFPSARIVRLDRDVASKLSDYQAVLNAMRSGEADFLVGTQMIAKGHDLPNVTVAAVVDCDVGLHMPDFRANERVFQLLSQLSGRAGRGSKPGQVILQTRMPKHPSILFTSRHDYIGFAKQQLSQRETFNYPPYGRLLRIIISSTEETLVQKKSKELENLLSHFIKSSDAPIQLLGPTTCAIEKIKTRWRWHILLKSIQPVWLLKAGTVVRDSLKENPKIRVAFDMDPLDML